MRIIFALLFFVFVSCHRNALSSLTNTQRNEKVISIAKEEVIKRFEIPAGTKTLVELNDTVYVVTFIREITSEDSPLIPSYYCIVYIDSKTGKVTRVATGN
ncbi:MAG TPA: hypothetical protein VMV56_01340 [Williamwhitmania sp.]|nr:hypothetical protein [Williamwhitmania sp.]